MTDNNPLNTNNNSQNQQPNNSFPQPNIPNIPTQKDIEKMINNKTKDTKKNAVKMAIFGTIAGAAGSLIEGLISKFIHKNK